MSLACMGRGTLEARYLLWSGFPCCNLTISGRKVCHLEAHSATLDVAMGTCTISHSTLSCTASTSLIFTVASTNVRVYLYITHTKVLVLYISVFTGKAHILCCFVTKITLEKTEGTIGNGQYRDTDDSGNKAQNAEKHTQKTKKMKNCGWSQVLAMGKYYRFIVGW